MPVRGSAFGASRLGLALGWQHGRLHKPHGGADCSFPTLLRVPPRCHGSAGPPNLSSVVSVPLGVTSIYRDAPGRAWLCSSRQVGGERACRGHQACGRKGQGATAPGASIDLAGR